MPVWYNIVGLLILCFIIIPLSGIVGAFIFTGFTLVHISVMWVLERYA